MTVSRKIDTGDKANHLVDIQIDIHANIHRCGGGGLEPQPKQK